MISKFRLGLDCGTHCSYFQIQSEVNICLFLAVFTPGTVLVRTNRELGIISVASGCIQIRQRLHKQNNFIVFTISKRWKTLSCWKKISTYSVLVGFCIIIGKTLICTCTLKALCFSSLLSQVPLSHCSQKGGIWVV